MNVGVSVCGTNSSFLKMTTVKRLLVVGSGLTGSFFQFSLLNQLKLLNSNLHLISLIYWESEKQIGGRFKSFNFSISEMNQSDLFLDLVSQ